MKQCPNGHNVGDNVKFCPECGKSIDEAQSNEPSVFDEASTKSGFKRYLPYIIGAIILLCAIGYFAISKGGGGLLSQTVSADSLAASNGDSNFIIADFDEKKVYSGEYVFDAVLTDAASEKNETTFTIKIEGNNVSIPLDDNKVMEGYIYKEDLGIDALYDYGDDLHYVSMSLKPKDKEGKEWVGEYRTNSLYCDVVLKLKECKNRGEVVKVTESRTEEESMSVEDENLPQTKFYELAQSGNFVWECKNALIDFWGGTRERITMYFYPSDKNSGRVSTIVAGESESTFAAALSGTTVYSISDNRISFSYSNKLNGMFKSDANEVFVFNFNGIIEKSGGAIMLVGKTSYRQSDDENSVFRIANKTETDPLN
jgi:hypothetical protein